MLAPSRSRVECCVISFSTILCGSILLGIILALQIAELVIGRRYLDDSTNTCHEGFISPARWVVVDGAMGVVEVFLILVVAGLMMLTKGEHNVLSMCPAVCCLAPAVAFQFAWTIVGAVVIWGNNNGVVGCGPSPLHDMMWASVIIHLVCIGLK